MRRLGRILRYLALTLSALLFVLTGSLWLRSLGHVEGYAITEFDTFPDWQTSKRMTRGIWRVRYIGMIDGRIWIRRWAIGNWMEMRTGVDHWRRSPLGWYGSWQYDQFHRSGMRTWYGGFEESTWSFGVGIVRRYDNVSPEPGLPPNEMFECSIPFWMPALVFGAWPGFVAVRLQLRRHIEAMRTLKGRCPKCGHDLNSAAYDLESPLSQCPKCGATFVNPIHRCNDHQQNYHLKNR